MSDKKKGTSRKLPATSEQPKWQPPPETLSEEDKARTAAQIKGNDVMLKLYREGKLEKAPPKFMANNGETDLREEFDMALQEYTLERDDNLPLQFKGYLVGWNDVDLSVARGTRVTIFVTKSNKIVTAVHQWQRGETKQRQRHAAGAHPAAQDALKWLIADGSGRLGRSSREAWELACQVWPALKGHDVEVLD